MSLLHVSVYCLEGPDNDSRVLDLVIPDDAELSTQFQPDLLGGVATISGGAETAKRTMDGRPSSRSVIAPPTQGQQWQTDARWITDYSLLQNS